MSEKEDDNLQDWDWALTFKKVAHIPYIPNPPALKRQNIYRRPNHTPPSVQPVEHYDWDTVTAKTYIHVIRCEGFFHYQRGRQLPRHFEGFETKPLNKEIKKRGLRNGQSYYGKGGSFHIQWGWQHRFRPYGASDLRLILRPDFRQPVWKSTEWATPIIQEVASRYSTNGLRMRYVELAVDLFGDFEFAGLPQCLWRGWADSLHIPEDSDRTSVYDGRKKRNRKDIIYFKDGASHFEARWEGKGLRLRGAVNPTTASILLLLLEMHRNMRFIHIDWNKCIRSPSVVERAPNLWQFFLAQGIVATLKQMRIHRILNPENKTSTHPIDTPFRRALANAIAEGVAQLSTHGSNISGFAPIKIRRRWADKSFFAELTGRVELLVRSEYKRLRPLRPHRRLKKLPAENQVAPLTQ